MLTQIITNIAARGQDSNQVPNCDGRNKNILVLGEGPTQGLDNATIIAEVKFSINFTESEKLFVLSLHLNGSNTCFC